MMTNFGAEKTFLSLRLGFEIGDSLAIPDIIWLEQLLLVCLIFKCPISKHSNGIMHPFRRIGLAFWGRVRKPGILLMLGSPNPCNFVKLCIWCAVAGQLRLWHCLLVLMMVFQDPGHCFIRQQIRCILSEAVLFSSVDLKLMIFACICLQHR